MDHHFFNISLGENNKLLQQTNEVNEYQPTSDKIPTIYETVVQEQQNIIANNNAETVAGAEITSNETIENIPLSADIISIDKLNKKVSCDSELTFDCTNRTNETFITSF